MLDATIKHIFQYTLLSACLFCSFSCGNSKQAEDSEKAEQKVCMPERTTTMRC